MTKRHFKPEFRQEVAELVLDKNYSVKEAATAMGVGNSTVDKWVRQLRKERDGLETKASPTVFFKLVCTIFMFSKPLLSYPYSPIFQGSTLPRQQAYNS